MSLTYADLTTDLVAANESTRLNAALAAGSNPDPALVNLLVERCAIEPDFYVRDMLTWALTRYPSKITLPLVLAELHSANAQARSQALHTLSKINQSSAYPAITRSLLRDSDDEVSRSAWRAAVVLVPNDQKSGLAEELATQFGRGHREMQLSLSRALLALGAEVIEPILRKAIASRKLKVRAHALATERLLRDPNAAFELGAYEAKKHMALKDRPV